MKVELLNENCMSVMANYPDGYFDLAVVDPEYGIGADKPTKKPTRVVQKNGRLLNIKNPVYKHKNWDSKPADSRYFHELKRVSKHQIIFGCNYYDFPLQGGRVVWDKLNGDSDQLGCEIAYCSLNNRTDIVYFLWSGMFQGVYCGKDVRKAIIQQGDKSLNEKRIHPTQKPIPLYYWLFNNYAKSDFKILDTHLGSASSAIAAHQIGISEFVGCELDKDYFDAAVKRYHQITSQQSLFTPAVKEPVIIQPTLEDLIEIEKSNIKQAS